MSNHHIGIVTVLYNSKSVIADFLVSCLAQENVNFTLYCIDNNSSDNTLAILTSFNSQRIKVIRNPQNFGFAKATNQGIKAAFNDACNYILLINNDTIFEKNMISILLRDLQKYNGDYISPKIVDYDNPNIIAWAGGDFSVFRAFANTLRGKGEVDNHQYDKVIQTRNTPFCCVLFNSICFEKNGFLDERFFVYWEDVDWCYNALKNNLQLLYTPNTKIVHKESSLTGMYSSFKISQLAEGRAKYLVKNFGNFYKFIFFPIIAATPLKLLIRRKISFNLFCDYITKYIQGK